MTKAVKFSAESERQVKATAEAKKSGTGKVTGSEKRARAAKKYSMGKK